MKTSVKIILIVAILLSFSTVQLIAAQAEITKVKGKAVIIKSADASEVDAKSGLKLDPGDRIKTMFASTAEVLLPDGSKMIVKPGSSMTISDLKKNKNGDSKVNLKLWLGNSRFKVNKKRTMQSTFRVRTPSAVCGVRGTDFGTGVDQNKNTSVKVYNGAVAVTGTGSNSSAGVMVNAGQQTFVKKGETPDQPTALPSGEEEGKKEEAVEGELYKILTPIPAGATNEPNFKIEGTAVPGIDLSINGNPVTISSSGVFEKALNLTVGENKIKLKATSESGEKQENEIELELDMIKPVIRRIQMAVPGYPADDFYFNRGFDKRIFEVASGIRGIERALYTASQVKITVFTDEDVKEVRMNKIRAINEGTGKYTMTIPFISNPNYINIEVEDVAGNVTTRKSGKFDHYVPEPPDVSSIEPIVTASPYDPKYIDGNKSVIIQAPGLKSNQKVMVKYFAGDNGNGQDELTSSKPTFTLPTFTKEDWVTIQYYGVDMLGYQSKTIKTKQYYLDLYAPTIQKVKDEDKGDGTHLITIKSNELLKSITINGTDKLNNISPEDKGGYYYYQFQLTPSQYLSGTVTVSGTDMANKKSTAF